MSQPASSKDHSEVILDLFLKGNWFECRLSGSAFLSWGVPAHEIIPVLVLISMQRLGQADEAEREGRLLANQGNRNQALAARLLLGLTSAEDALAGARDDEDRCRSLYYIGARARTLGQQELARQAWKLCLEMDVQCSERHLAAAEFPRLDLEPPLEIPETPGPLPGTSAGASTATDVPEKPTAGRCDGCRQQLRDSGLRPDRSMTKVKVVSSRNDLANSPGSFDLPARYICPGCEAIWCWECCVDPEDPRNAYCRHCATRICLG